MPISICALNISTVPNDIENENKRGVSVRVRPGKQTNSKRCIAESAHMMVSGWASPSSGGRLSARQAGTAGLGL